MKKSSSNITGLILANQINGQLEAALASLANLGPIKLIDTSLDKRCAKLARPGLSIIHLPSEKSQANFAQWRNQAIAACESEWFFFLDSDEVIDLEAQQAIETYVNNWTPDQAPLAALKRVDFFWGQALKHGEVGNNWQDRLGRTDQVKYLGRVHERAMVEGQEVAPQRLAGQIKHSAHPNLHQFIESVAWYADLASESRTSSRFQLLFELLTYPAGKFLVNFVIKSGWRDGWRGLTYALTMSLHSLWVRIYQYEKRIAK